MYGKEVEVKLNHWVRGGGTSVQVIQTYENGEWLGSGKKPMTGESLPE